MADAPHRAPPDEADARRSGLLWTTLAYLGEGLPYSLLHQLTTEYLTSTGASPAVVAQTSWFHLPVTSKPLLSLIVERGASRRRWVIAMQALWGIGMLAFGQWIRDGGHSGLSLFWVVLGVLAVAHACHDIACDGLYMDALDADGRARYSGTRQAAFRAAMYLGGSLLVMLASPTRDLGAFGREGQHHYGVSYALGGALLVGLAALNAWVLPHPRRRALASSKAPRTAQLLEPLASFFRQPEAGRMVAFALAFRLGDTMTSSMSSVMLRSQGLDEDARGLLRGISLSTTIVVSILAGLLLARHGVRRWLLPFTLAMLVPWYLGMSFGRLPMGVVFALAALEQACGALAGTAAPVLMMERCAKAFSASHYAFFTALVSLGSTVAGSLAGPLFERVSPAVFYGLALCASLPALGLVRWITSSPTAETT